jgi:hypothetical protein
MVAVRNSQIRILAYEPSQRSKTGTEDLTNPRVPTFPKVVSGDDEDDGLTPGSSPGVSSESTPVSSPVPPNAACDINGDNRTLFTALAINGLRFSQSHCTMSKSKTEKFIKTEEFNWNPWVRLKALGNALLGVLGRKYYSAKYQ